jgi:uncharacterized protein YacL
MNTTTILDSVNTGLLIIVIIGIFGPLKRAEAHKSPGMGRAIILDSCALIDGRIVEILAAGFAADTLIIPEFILRELQLLADGNDTHKRNRARFGLDIAQKLQSDGHVTVTIDHEPFPSIKATDDKLIALAQKRRAALYTTDYNLNKVAVLEGVHVLNVNELAQQLRPIMLPGETITIKILQRGSNKQQGVGYMEDGTMVVVDNAARFMGKTISANVDRMHQTMAGKMVFANLIDQPAAWRSRKPA